MKGFFAPSTWQAQRRPLPLLAECGACGIHAGCEHPFMPVSGRGRRGVLLVGEGPGQEEDRKGYQFCGNAGYELMRLLHNVRVNMREDCWLTNAVVCRPRDEYGNNRKPTPDEVRWCLPNLAGAVKTLNPRVIVPLGEPAVRAVMALAWEDGWVDDVGTWVGWDVPCRRLNCWVCPTYHPSFVAREKDKNRAVELHVDRHLKAAFAHAERPYPNGVPDDRERVNILMDPRQAAEVVRAYAARGRPLAFDFETTMLKPDAREAAVLCCAVSDGVTAVAFPWIGAAVKAVKELAASPVPLIAANMKFEERWCRKVFGHGVRNWHWDTMLGAHWSDCRHGICSLKFQAWVRLGVEPWSTVDESMEADDSNSENTLRREEKATLFLYNALDSLYEVQVAEHQMKELGVDGRTLAKHSGI